MYTHAPQNYDCPFCRFSQSIGDEQNVVKQTDMIFQNEHVTAFLATRMIPNNPGHVLIIPNEHFENIYDLPTTIVLEIQVLAKAVALAMKTAYACDGITLRQHNEPSGGQHIWHYHLHVIPRYEDDDYDCGVKQPFPPDERAFYVEKLQPYVKGYLLTS
ncbi:MAG: HIT domain-containing protein [Chloroflexi bacterium]|nr:HIT domain-containing protein [Chloroflexota bacterium]